MFIKKISVLAAISLLTAGLIYAAEESDAGENAAPATPPVFAPVKSSPGQGPGKQNRPAAFNAEMSADFMRKVMETSAKIEAVKKQMADRRIELFESNPEIKACQEQMTDLQTEINSILAKDDELAKMEMERDILWTTMPPMPGARHRPGMPRGMFPVMRK